MPRSKVQFLQVTKVIFPPVSLRTCCQTLPKPTQPPPAALCQISECGRRSHRSRLSLVILYVFPPCGCGISVVSFDTAGDKRQSYRWVVAVHFPFLDLSDGRLSPPWPIYDLLANRHTTPPPHSRLFSRSFSVYRRSVTGSPFPAPSPLQLSEAIPPDAPVLSPP